MTPDDARAQYNHLLSLCIRREEVFGPMALTFLREQDLGGLGLAPEERFNLCMAVADAFAAEPKRYTHKLECLEKAQALLPQTPFAEPGLARYLSQQIDQTKAELDIYAQAMRVRRPQDLQQQRLVVDSEVPQYFLDVAQKRAAAYYQTKYRMPQEAKTAVHFGGTPQRFEPDNRLIHKEFPGACAPFMSARTAAFHVLLPFDLKISRRPDDPLDAGVRIFYSKLGYSYPLRYEMGRLCGYHDGRVVELALDDPNLLFVSVSAVKEPEFPLDAVEVEGDLPPDCRYSQAMLDRAGSLGPYIQIMCNFKIWFDATLLSILIQGAPDLHEYGLSGGTGLMTRTYASDKTAAYAESFREPWQEGLSYNFVNLHLQLLPGVESAVIPFNTPIFTLYPVLSRQNVRIEPRAAMDRSV